MLAGSTRQAIGRPNVSTRMWRLRPFTSLCPSKPRTPPRSVVLTDCPSMMTTEGHADRPAFLAGLLIDFSLQTRPHPGVFQYMEIVIHGAPGGKLARKKTPLAAGAQQIEDRVDDS